MSFISKLKPRIKPRLGGKGADGPSDTNTPSSGTCPPSTATPASIKEDAKTNLPSSGTCPPSTATPASIKEDPKTNSPSSGTCPPSTATPASIKDDAKINLPVRPLDNDHPPDQETLTCHIPKANEATEKSVPAVETDSNEEKRTICNVPNTSGSDLPGGKIGNTFDSTNVDISAFEDPSRSTHSSTTAAKSKEVTVGLREKPKPRIIGLKHYKPVIKKQVRPISAPDSSFLTQPAATINNQTVVNILEPNTATNSSEVSKFLELANAKAQESQNLTYERLSADDGNVKHELQEITHSSIQIEATTERKGNRFSDNQVNCKDSPERDGINDVNKGEDVEKPSSLIKRPPKILRKAPKLDRSRSAVSHNSDKLPTVASLEKVSFFEATDSNEREEIMASEENVSGVQDLENVSDNHIPIIDTTKSRSQTSGDIAPLSTVDSNTDKSGSSTKSKTSKSDMEDVRTLCAISAVDYLRRHDHALGDSIIRRLIIGSKNMQNRNLKATMCSSCNPQTLQKCLASLWSFHKDELQVILRKSAERQKAPLTFANFSGKPSFKPSLGRQRAPTLTASTYGKMCFEVKEGLAKKYGPKAPELSKLRMLDLIFYNPSDNPMTKQSVEGDSSETTSKKSSSSNPSTSTSRQNIKSESCTKGSDVCDSDADDPEIIEERCDSTNISSSINDHEQNNNNIPVPQVRIGDEGQIILAPESLVLKQKESEVLNYPVVHESDFAGVIRKRGVLNRTSWSFEETVKFYKSLHGMGTDFSSMLTLFPDRTRKNLKAKFKREERKNSALIDKVLSAQGQALNMTDVEKDLAADKTLRRLCIETAAQKYSPGSAISCILKPSQRRKKRYFSDDEEQSCFYGKAGSLEETKGALASRIPNRLRSVESRQTPIAKTSENETEYKRSVADESCDTKEENATGVASEESLPSNEASTKLNSKKPAETFKKPIGRPPVQRKRKLDKKMPNMIKREKISKSKEPPRLHTICLDDSDEDENEEVGGGNTAETDPTNLDIESNRDDCFVIETNYENKSFNCVKSVTFSVDNPSWPVDVNATIEHKNPPDDVVTENESSVDDSGEIVQVVTININQLPSYLEQTGAVVVEAEGI